MENVNTINKLQIYNAIHEIKIKIYYIAHGASPASW